MPTLSGHTNCCGIYVLSGFYDPKQKAYRMRHETQPAEDGGPQWARTVYPNGNPATVVDVPLASTLQAEFETNMAAVKSSDRVDSGKNTEVVLTDGQCRQYEGVWPKLLKEHGFRLVTRFRNTSGSVCNIFHRTAPQVLVEGFPPNWTE